MNVSSAIPSSVPVRSGGANRASGLPQTVSFLHDLADRGFWGTALIAFQAGRVSFIRLEETLKPQDLPEQPRSRNERVIPV